MNARTVWQRVYKPLARASLQTGSYVVGVVSVLIGTSFLVFSLGYLTGDPTNALLPADTPPEAVEAFRLEQGLNRPFLTQYGLFLGRAFRGNFGTSLRYREPAFALVASRLGASGQLLLLSLGFASILSIGAGLLSAYYAHTALDSGLRTSVLIGQALPPFMTAQLLILLFAVGLQWLPATGSPSWQGLVLPVLATSSFSVATLTKLLRSSALDVLAQDYIRTAKAKGLSWYWITLKHTLRNALIPMLAALSSQVNSLIAGTAVVETVFAYPGMGRLLVEAANARDIPLIQAFVSIVALFVVMTNLGVDALYKWIDPRLQENV
ncbi:MAG: ABC transporter permease [Deinococcota bacterium]